MTGVLLASGLTAASYGVWLRREAVAYVALPGRAARPLERAGGEADRGGLPYLREVFASRHWRIYEVLAATPLLSGPGRLETLASDSFTVLATRAGGMLVRLHYNRYLTVTAGVGCVGPGGGGWTGVDAARPGRLTVAARFSLGAALSGSKSCSRDGRS